MAQETNQNKKDLTPKEIENGAKPSPKENDPRNGSKPGKGKKTGKKTGRGGKQNKKPFPGNNNPGNKHDNPPAPKTSQVKLNSPTFYGAGTALTDRASDLSTAFVQGTDVGALIPVDGAENQFVFKDNSHRFGLGRILALKTQFIMPDSETASTLTDVFPKTAWALWNALRGTKTSTVPFDPQDLQCYIIALANIIGYANHINRRIKAISVAFNSNKYWPYVMNGVLGQMEQTAPSTQLGFAQPSVGTSSLFNAYNNELTKIAQNKLNLTEALVQLIATPAPQGIPLLERARVIYSYIYSDDLQFNGANYYCFVPSLIYEYDGTIPGLKAVAISGSSRTIEDEIQILKSAIRAFTFDSDMATIGAWIRDNLGIDSTPVLLDCDITAGFGCSEMLEAIANSHTHPIVNANVQKSATGQTWKNTGCILDLGAASESQRLLYSTTLNESMWLHSYHPISKDDILINTRFKPIYSIVSGQGTTNPKFGLQCDFYLVNYYTMYILGAPTVDAKQPSQVVTWSFTSAGTLLNGTAINEIAMLEAELAGFEYHPDIIPCKITSTDAGSTITASERFTYDNHFMKLNGSRLPLLHQAAIYGELGIYAAFVRAYSKVE